MSRFETDKELRKELERRSGKLSDKEWASLPHWSPPYDDADLAELLDAAERLPSRKAAKAAQKAQDFAADVQRLQNQFLALDAGDDCLSIQARGAAGVWKLDQLVEGSDFAALVADRGGYTRAEVEATYLEIGMASHVNLAIEWLAKRYCIPWVFAACALCGFVDAAQPLLTLIKTTKVGRPIPTTVKGWAKLARRTDDEPDMGARRTDTRGLLRMRRDGTQALLWRMMSMDGALWESWERGRIDYKKLWGSWERGRIEYEKQAHLWVDTDNGARPRHFDHWRAFRQAAYEVAKRLWRYRARAEERRGSR